MDNEFKFLIDAGLDPNAKDHLQEDLNKIDSLLAEISHANLNKNAKDELAKTLKDIKMLRANVQHATLNSEAKKELKNALSSLTNLTANISNARLDNNFLNSLQGALRSINNLTVNVSGININNQQLAQQAQQAGQQVGQQLNRGVRNALSNTSDPIADFRQSLQNIGMETGTINAVIGRIQALGITVEKLAQARTINNGARNSTDILSVEVTGVDSMQNAVKMIQQFNLETGELIKMVDAVSSATEREAATIDSLTASQTKRRADLRNQVNQIYTAAMDRNAPRSISNDSNRGQLTSLYGDIITEIDNLTSHTKTGFAEQEAVVTGLITRLKNLINEYKNAENVQTKLKPDKIAEASSKLESQFRALNSDIQNSGVSSEKLSTNLLELEGIVGRIQAGEILDKASLERGFQALSNAKNEAVALKTILSSDNSVEKISYKVNTLENKLNEFGSKNSGFAQWKRQINDTEESLESLLQDLKRVKTESDYQVASARVDSFISQYKSEHATTTGTKIQDINNNVANKTYDTAIKQQIASLQKYGLTATQAEEQVKGLRQEMQIMANTNLSDEVRIAAEMRWQQELAKSKNVVKEYRLEWQGLATEQQRLSLANRIEAFMQKNTKITKEARDELQRYISTLRNLGTDLPINDFKQMNISLKDTENRMRALGKLGYALKDQMKQAANSFVQWISVSNAVMYGIYKTREAVKELVEVDNILTEISKTSDMTKKELVELGNTSFESASKLGRTAPDYLNTVMDMSRSGFYGAQGEAMAEQVLLAQTAGDMSQEVASNYVIATNAAYKYAGDVEKINKVIDGANLITNRYSVTLSDMAESMSIAGTVASSYRVNADELTAMTGVIESVTKLGGNEVGNALKAILINLQNITSSKIVGTLERAGASMTEVVNGATKMRTPVEILKDLAVTFNSLDEDDPLRAEILTNIGQKYHAQKLAALLSNMDKYDEMLVTYAEGTGSAAEEAEKSANNVE